MSDYLMEALSYAHSMLRKAAGAMDKTSVDWAEVATAEHYVGHIVEGRATSLGEAAEVEHERFVASQGDSP